MSDLAVIGAGAWGTALALLAARAGHRVTLWARNPDMAAQMQDTRLAARLPGVVLPPEIQVTATLPAASLSLLVVPTQHLRGVAAALPAGGAVLACCKGIESSSLALPLAVLEQVCPGRPAGVLSGPNFAHEIAAGLPAATVVASYDSALRAQVTAALAGPQFRLYGNADPVGVQIGGAAKNVIAIAAGIVAGRGLGENARAALVTRGLAEIARLAVAAGGRADTVAGLSGRGDLLLTCTGPSSRNYRFGFGLGQGVTPAALLAGQSHVTEGATTAPAMLALAHHLGASLPICETVAAIVQGRIVVDAGISLLLSRPQRDE